MNKISRKLKDSFKTEMLAAGLYNTMSGQCENKNPELAARLKQASEEEYYHGTLFRGCHNEIFSKTILGEKFWRFMGAAAGALLRPVPLKTKLKFLSKKEKDAVRMIEKELGREHPPVFTELLNKIYPDEKAHAEIYDEHFRPGP